MIERLFLDGVDLESGGRSVTKTVQFAVLIHADVTETGLALPNVTVARAEVAVNAIVRFALPPESLVERRGGLEDLKSGHDASTAELIIRFEREIGLLWGGSAFGYWVSDIRNQERRRVAWRRWAAQLAKDFRLRRYFQLRWRNFFAVRLAASYPRKVSKRHWM